MRQALRKTGEILQIKHIIHICLPVGLSAWCRHHYHIGKSVTTTPSDADIVVVLANAKAFAHSSLIAGLRISIPLPCHFIIMSWEEGQ